MFPERLKLLRKKAGLTQKELALAINTSQQNIGFYELGKRNPKKEILENLSNFFSVSTEYLEGNTDNPEPVVTELDIETAINNSVAYDGSPITDNDRQIIKEFLKDYFANKENE